MSELIIKYVDEKFDSIDTKIDQINDKLDILVSEKEEKSESSIEEECNFIIEDDAVSYIYQIIPYRIEQLDNQKEIDRMISLQKYIKKNYDISIKNLIIFYGHTINNMIKYVKIDNTEFKFKIDFLKKSLEYYYD